MIKYISLSVFEEINLALSAITPGRLGMANKLDDFSADCGNDF